MKKLRNSVSDHESKDNKNMKQRIGCHKAQRTWATYMKGKVYSGSHNGDLGECQTDSGGALPHAGRAVTTEIGSHVHWKKIG